MNIPILVFLGFAGWTVLTLCVSVGAYRWSLILTGRASVAEWRAEKAQGSEWYQRAMRAHLNCVENLPVFGALGPALVAMNLQSRSVDALSITLFVARIGQTLVHLAPSLSEVLATLRFALFFVQIVCMVWIGTIIALSSMD